MSETTTRALRANAFVPTNVRRFELDITDEPQPTKAEALLLSGPASMSSLGMSSASNAQTAN